MLDEVIEKAYKVLAKKYHPDLQTAENKKMAEDRMKEINDAYETLSNSDKRKVYDEELKRKKEEEAYIKTQQEQKRQESYGNGAQYNSYQSKNVNASYANNQTNTSQKDEEIENMARIYEEELKKYEEKRRRQMESKLQQEYQNAYYNYLRSLGYRIKERWTWKKTKELLITLLIIVVVFIIIWFFPPTHNMLVNFYESNRLVKVVVDIFVNIFSAIFKAIGSIFTK